MITSGITLAAHIPADARIVAFFADAVNQLVSACKADRVVPVP